ITMGKLELHREPVDLGGVVQEVAARFAEVAERAGSPIDIAVDDDVHGSWDRLRIEQVLTNLISNAVKYGDGKPIAIEVRSDGGAAQIVVRDRGIGIGAESVGRIFGRFE